MKIIVFTICILTAVAVIFIGCDKLKGDKGDTGPTGPQGSGYENLWEDFETSTFTKYPWQLTGTANWQIASDYVMFGSKAACSGTIYNSQYTTLSITVDLPVASICSFYWKIDCETGYDGLMWLIDGDPIDGRSGNSGDNYYPATFGIAPGTHTISWIYTKDGSGSSGLDRVWVDGILITDYKLTQKSSFNNPIPSGVISLKHQK
jgi:hypothetical protein